jgi:hypothetical protein
VFLKIAETMKKFIILVLLIASSCSFKTHRTGFYIERSSLTTIEGVLFLRDNTGHCHLLESVTELLNDSTFRKFNPSLVPIFEKAKIQMEKGETGKIK